MIHDIARHHPQVRDAALRRLSLDELPLPARTGQRHDLRTGIVFRDPHAERTPAATEIEHTLAVGKLRAYRVFLQHRLFGLRECLPSCPVEAARILQPRPEMALEKRRRQFVMPRIRRPRFDSDRARAQFIDQAVEALRARFAVVEFLIAQTLFHQPPHAEAHEGIGDPAAFAPVDQPAVRWRFLLLWHSRLRRQVAH